MASSLFERLELLVELRREQLDLLDQDLDAVGGDGVGDELPHLLSAAGQVEAVVAVAGAGGAPDLAEPAQVGVIGEGALVRQQHVHRLAEAAEGEVELGADVLRLQHPHAGIEVVGVGHRLEEPHRRGVPALQPRQLVHARGERPLDLRGREDVERLLQLGGHAPVVDDQAVGLLLPVRAVHAGDGLQQGVLLEGRVEIHDLLDRRVEPGEQHVAHDQHGQGIVTVLEPFDEPVLLLLAQVPARQPLLVVVTRRHDQRRLRPVQQVQRLLVADRGVAAGGHHLGLEAVRGDELVEVLEEIQADRLDAARGVGDLLLGGEASLDDGPLLFAAVGEDAVEDLVDGLPDDLQLREPALVEDRHRRLVPDGLLYGIGVDVGGRRSAGCCGPSCRSGCR